MQTWEQKRAQQLHLKRVQAAKPTLLKELGLRRAAGGGGGGPARPQQAERRQLPGSQLPPAERLAVLQATIHDLQPLLQQVKGFRV